MQTIITIHEDKPVIKSWIDDAEVYQTTMVNGKPVQALWEQTQNIALLPNTFHHVALMPDAHSGFGMPIGGVLALDGAICPGAVGYDIGCGMNALKTDVPFEALKDWDVRIQLCREIKKLIPVGEGGSRSITEAQRSSLPEVTKDDESVVFINDRAKRTYGEQPGTLGSGNHFIEFDRDVDGNVWIVVHSGSRGFGHAVAGYYMKKAVEECTAAGIKVHPELAFFLEGTDSFNDYRTAMDIALDWAFISRDIMTGDALKALEKVVGRKVVGDSYINVHHNYASLEEHFDEVVWVHRKGATAAFDHTQLVIPGNMGDGTAICRGLGNPDSFCTSSHGAGRRMGRNEAKRKLNLEEQQAYLKSKDVYVSAGRDGALDEMPAAYKDFDQVLERQADLVEVVHRLYPIAVVKG